MSCEHCLDPETGDVGYPVYGLGPHVHDTSAGWIGSTRTLNVQHWPDNYEPDPDAPGCGTWFCPKCKAGMPRAAGAPV